MSNWADRGDLGPQVVVGEGGRGVDSAGEDALAERAERDEADTELAEDSVLARDFIDEAIARNRQVPHTVHADRGTSMTSQPVCALLANLGVTRNPLPTKRWVPSVTRRLHRCAANARC